MAGAAGAEAGPGMNERLAGAGPACCCCCWRPASMALSESERCVMPEEEERLARSLSLRAFLPELDLQRDEDFGLVFEPVDVLVDSDSDSDLVDVLDLSDDEDDEVEVLSLSLLDSLSLSSLLELLSDDEEEEDEEALPLPELLRNHLRSSALNGCVDSAEWSAFKMVSFAFLLPASSRAFSVRLGESVPAVLSHSPANCHTGTEAMLPSLSKTESAFCCESVPSPAASAPPADGAIDAQVCSDSGGDGEDGQQCSQHAGSTRAREAERERTSGLATPFLKQPREPML